MADRAFVLGRLRRELAAARDVREYGYAAELEREIAALSQGSAADPRREAAGGTVRPRRPRPAR